MTPIKRGDFSPYIEVVDMNFELERKIIDYRKAGLGYKKIASILNISKNSVASFCKRNDVDIEGSNEVSYCKECGLPFNVDKKHPNKRFCSLTCKNRWWNKNRNKDNLKTFICPVCGASFLASISSKRKYCSHACYIKSRYHKEDMNNG